MPQTKTISVVIVYMDAVLESINKGVGIYGNIQILKELNNDTVSIKRLDTTIVCEGVWQQAPSERFLL